MEYINPLLAWKDDNDPLPILKLEGVTDDELKQLSEIQAISTQLSSRPLFVGQATGSQRKGTYFVSVMPHYLKALVGWTSDEITAEVQSKLLALIESKIGTIPQRSVAILLPTQPSSSSSLEQPEPLRERFGVTQPPAGGGSFLVSRLQPIYCMSCVAAVTEGFQSAFEASKGVNFATDGIQFLRLKEKGDYVVSLSTRPRAGYWLHAEMLEVAAKCKKGAAIVSPASGNLLIVAQDPILGTLALPVNPSAPQLREDETFLQSKRAAMFPTTHLEPMRPGEWWVNVTGSQGSGSIPDRLLEKLKSDSSIRKVMISSVGSTNGGFFSASSAGNSDVNLDGSGLSPSCSINTAEFVSSPSLSKPTAGNAQSISVGTIILHASPLPHMQSWQHLQSVVTGFGVELHLPPPNHGSVPSACVVLRVPGMACDGCAQGLRGKLLALKGVVAAAVSQPEATALVAIELAKTSANDILTSVQLGHKEASFVSTINSKEYEHLALFPLGLRKECLNVACKCASCECIVCECGTSAIEMKEVPTRTPTTTSIEVSVEGMSCGSCAMRIQRSLLEMAGVRQAAVVFDTKKATVHFSRSTVGADAIVQRIRDLGYKANAECISTVAPSTLTLPSSFEQTDRSELEDSTSHNSKKLASPTATAASPSKLKPAATVVAIPQGPTVKSTFIVQGMTCASCAARIETTLIQKPGILSATVNFATSTASVSFDGSALHSGDVIGMIDSLGYVAQAQNNQSNAQTINQAKGALERTEEIRTMLRRFLLSVIFTLPLFVLMMVDDKVQNTFLAKKVYGDAMVMEIVSWVLSTPVVFIFGRHFFIRAAVAARHRSATMDTLVAVGVGGAYGFSTIGIILELASVGMMKNYFDAAAELITFMLLGKFLEAKAKRGTSGALLQLMTLAPQKSILVKKDGSEMEVETSELMVDDLFRVPSGGRIAVDGIVENGASAVDEQLITGESVPVDKRKGDKVIAGTLCLDSDLVVKATKVGSDTTLARILQVVQDAQTTKPAIQRLADKVASVFVPFILIYSSIVLGLWLVASYDGWYPAAWRGDQTQFIFSFQFFLSSVVVACPCAMGLAVPTAMMVGTGIAAKNGLLVKDGPTLETVSKSNVVLFDKTGTLTTGILAVDSTVVNSHFTDERLIGLSETELKMLVGTVESRSTHPVAVAITKAYGTIPAVPESQLRQAAAREANGGGSLNGSGNSATKTSPLDRNYSNSGDSGDEGPATPVAASTTWNLPAAISNLNVVTKAGNGVEATLLFRSGLKRDRIVDVQLVVGKPSFLRSEGFAFDAYTEQAIKEAQGKGCTVVAAAINGTVAVVTALSDQPKETAAACVKALFAKGREVFMVSGDHTLAALHIASLVGIPPENVHAEVLPWNKAEVVKSHQGEGKVVCFVGDGLNDSPALTQADVGVALGAGTEIAIEAADAVLMKNSLQDLVTFFDLSRTIIRRVYFNFVWAFMYNLVMLPLTSGLLFILTQQQIPPVVAGIAMVSSSLTVLASSLALKLYTPPKLNRDSAGRRGDRVSLLRQ